MFIRPRAGAPHAFELDRPPAGEHEARAFPGERPRRRFADAR